MRRRRCRRAALFLVWAGIFGSAPALTGAAPALAGAAPARVGAPSVPPGSEVMQEVVLPPPPPYTLRRWLQAGAQLDVAHHLHPAMKQVYGRAQPFAASIFAAILFEERIGVGVSLGLHRRAGVGVAPVGAPPDVVLWQVPIAVEGWLRMALVHDQPVVPILRFGAHATVARENVFLVADGAETVDAAAEVEVEATAGDATGSARRVPDMVWQGRKFGVQASGGVQIRLPFPEVAWEGSATSSVLQDVYLQLLGWARASNDFGAPGVDLSAVGVSAGITLML